MIAAEISIWATEPIWSSVWKRWQIKHCQSAFHSGGSHLQTLHGENGGSAELQSHCDAQLQKTTWQDIFLAAQNGWVAARPVHHDTMPSWNDLCWIFRWKVKKGKFHICHFVRPCQNHVGRVLEIGNCTKVVLKLCLSGQIIIKSLSSRHPWLFEQGKRERALQRNLCQQSVWIQFFRLQRGKPLRKPRKTGKKTGKLVNCHRISSNDPKQVKLETDKKNITVCHYIFIYETIVPTRALS